ncbi:hypothetical protein M0R45_013159 [Rubus argutus]|jgi:Fe-S-cluster containining protein|uniref:Uncharacterized protein n=1 Tax=Rubus argutus TaxID=59490 RepID=A0AAW1XJ95_RUBAR
MNMGFVGSLSWVNAFGRKKCRSLFWRMRAALKKAMKNSGKQRRFRFQYDPSSYALNFDDGCWKLGEGGACALRPAKPQACSDINNTLWVCVLLVNSE